MTGLPQAQISKAENAAVDLRLSSLITLTRALELEVELIPRRFLPAVQSIVRDGGQSGAVRGVYSLEDADDV